MPLVTRLYAGLLATAVYVFFGTSRQVIFGPTSALAILLAASVGSIATGGTGSDAGLLGLLGVVCRLVRRRSIRQP